MAQLDRVADFALARSGVRGADRREVNTDLPVVNELVRRDPTRDFSYHPDTQMRAVKVLLGGSDFRLSIRQAKGAILPVDAQVAHSGRDAVGPGLQGGRRVRRCSGGMQPRGVGLS